MAAVDESEPADALAALGIEVRGAAQVVALARWGELATNGDAARKIGAWLSAVGRSPDVYCVVLRLSASDAVDRVAETPESLAALTDLVWRLECFPKPCVALLDGPVSGALAALSGFVTHRVGGAHFTLSLPPPAVTAGLPLAGLAYRIARADRGAADWARGGGTIDRTRAYAWGLLTHVIDEAAFDAVIAALADGQPVDPLLDGLQAPSVSTGSLGVPALSHAPAPSQGGDDIDRQLFRRLLEVSAGADIRTSLIVSHRVAVARTAASRSGRRLDAADLDRLFGPIATDTLDLSPRADIVSRGLRD